MTFGGFGVGVRAEFIAELPTTSRCIDWLEIIPENFMNLPASRLKGLERCAERWPLVPHSISMSIGGPSPLDAQLFRAVTTMCHRFRSPYWSDHVCFSTIGALHTNDLLPLPFSNEALEYVLSRIADARTLTDMPLVFENPTYYAKMPGATMTETEFLRAIAEQSGSMLLLDVNNVYVNSQNHGFDPEAFIREFPLDAVCQIHLAGHTHHPGVIIDTHVGPVPEPVWALYRYTIAQAKRQIPTLIEWDQDVPALNVVVDEVDRARAESAAALGASTTVEAA